MAWASLNCYKKIKRVLAPLEISEKRVKERGTGEGEKYKETFSKICCYLTNCEDKSMNANTFITLMIQAAYCLILNVKISHSNDLKLPAMATAIIILGHSGISLISQRKIYFSFSTFHFLNTKIKTISYQL